MSIQTGTGTWLGARLTNRPLPVRALYVDLPDVQVLAEGTLATPPAWDSSLCMRHWGVPELSDEPDPKGYLIYVNGR